MPAASYVLALNLVIAAMFALAFLFIGLNNRSDRTALIFALAYIFGIFYTIAEFIAPLQIHPRIAHTLGFAAFLATVTTVAVGIAYRYRASLPAWLVVAFVLLSILANWQASALPSEDFFRNLTYQAPYAMAQGFAALLILRSRRRRPVDLSLAVLFSLSAVQFLSKPFAAVLLGGAGDNAQAYLASNYAVYSQSLGAILVVGTGLLVLWSLFHDMLEAVTTRSETDPLSGLLNRRGFEDRARLKLERDTLPATLILADLDAFKAINDRHGHHVGDEVIIDFARLLQSIAPGQIAGRLGGEEFALFLPDIDLDAAHQLADTLRLTFAGQPVGTGVSCTASFGVAERMPGEDLIGLRVRADAALYAAKRSGRNCVILAAPTLADTLRSQDEPAASAIPFSRSA